MTVKYALSRAVQDTNLLLCWYMVDILSDYVIPAALEC